MSTENVYSYEAAKAAAEQAEKAKRKRGPGGGGGKKPAAAIAPTEYGLALELARRLEHLARFDCSAGHWLMWDGQIWQRDERGAVLRAAAALAAEIGQSLESWNDRRTLGRRGTANGVVGLAAVDERLVVTAADLDSDPLLLGTPGGTVDLRTGELRPGEPADLITRSTVITPAPRGTPAPAFDAFLDFATGNDPCETGWDDLKRYVMAMLGYSLTGLVKWHLIHFLYGDGGNGKNTLLDLIQDILGSYAVTAPMEMFLETRYERHPAERMLLRGRRFVRASEIPEGRTWNDALLKQLSGGDKVSARAMNEDWCEFPPTHKLILVGNNRPTFRQVDEAVRRRFRLLPFEQKPRQVDVDLPERLRAEAPAVLRLCIDAWLELQASGAFPASGRVMGETTSYLEVQDTLGDFIAAEAEVDQRPLPFDQEMVRDWISRGLLKMESSRLVFDRWKAFAERSGERIGAQKGLTMRLTKAGFRSWHSREGGQILGLQLRGFAGGGDGSGRS
jgi:putative DNA primase/helicase